MSGDIPSAPNRDDTGKAPQEINLQLDLGGFSRSKRPRTDDQTQRTRPRSNLRYSYLLLGEIEGGCVTRTLPPDEADPANPALLFSNDYEHFVFFDVPSFIDNSDPVSLRYRVFDEERREYEMKLSRTSILGIKVVSLESSDWAKIVSDHNLRVGDEVCFDRYLDTNFSDDFFYILKCIRNGENDDARKEAKVKQKVSEPSNAKVDSKSAGTPSRFNIAYRQILLQKVQGSSYFPPEAYCLTKTLRRDEVIPREGKLYLTLEDAVVLTDNPKTAGVRPRAGFRYSKEIVVFDENNRKYKMTLNHHLLIAQRGFGFCLGGGWIDFVTIHNLEEGDQVMMYKFLDSSFYEGYCHVVRYVKRKPANAVRIMNDPVRAAEGIPIVDVSDQRRNIPLAADDDRRSDFQTLLPSTRFWRPSDHCMIKTLDPRDLSGLDPRLHLDAFSEAKFLIKVPIPDPSYPLGKVRKNLLVYDKDDKPYEMSLSHYASRSGDRVIITYTLGGEWKKFVRVHGLRVGDRITIYTALSKRYWPDYYYVFRKLPGNE